MQRLFCFASVLVLIFAGYVYAQDVAVVYDSAIENGGGLAVPNPNQLAEMIVEELESKKLTAEIVDADEVSGVYERESKGDLYHHARGTPPARYLKTKARKTLSIHG